MTSTSNPPEPWSAELARLRAILQETPLEETIKWGAPCYTANGKNVVGMAAFKAYFGLWFHQGALLADEAGVLINAQEGKTKALRQWRFASAKEIKPRIIKRYVREAIALAAEGRSIKPERQKPLSIPAELSDALARSKKSSTAFASLSKGKQREYADYIAEAKREETKLKRVDKILPMIAAGQGLHDKYPQLGSSGRLDERCRGQILWLR